MTIIGSASKLKMYRTILKTKVALTCEVQQNISIVSPSLTIVKRDDQQAIHKQ